MTTSQERRFLSDIEEAKEDAAIYKRVMFWLIAGTAIGIVGFFLAIATGVLSVGTGHDYGGWVALYCFMSLIGTAGCGSFGAYYFRITNTKPEGIHGSRIPSDNPKKKLRKIQREYNEYIMEQAK